MLAAMDYLITEVTEGQFKVYQKILDKVEKSMSSEPGGQGND